MTSDETNAQALRTDAWGPALAPYGIAPLAVTELRDWSESRVLRIEGRADGRPGIWYAKLGRSGGDREWAVYRLADGLPGLLAARPGPSSPQTGFPAPTARFVPAFGEEWLLLDEAPGALLAHRKGDAAAYRAAAAGLARFHARAAADGWSEPLAGLGRLDERLPLLAERALAATARALQQGTYGGVAASLLADCETRLLPRWPGLASRLQQYPVSLCHGDCHHGNLFLQADGSVVLIDWASALLGPGLLDLVALADVSERMKALPCPAEELRAVYLDALPAVLRDGYGDADQAWAACRVTRALLELIWFAETGEDYGTRAARELHIIAGLV